jgi:hypothetical protein
MIELIRDLPGEAIGFRAFGQVTKRDYEDVVEPAIKSMVERKGKINFLLVLDTDIKNYTIGADYKDIMMGLKFFTKWNKIAVVTDQDVVKNFIVGINYPLPGETKSFSMAAIEEAKKWVVS